MEAPRHPESIPYRPVEIPATNAAMAWLRSLSLGRRRPPRVEGRNLIIERRGGKGDAQRTQILAAELVRLNVEVIVAFGAVASLAVRDATQTIPAVTRTGDPVLLGLVTNLSRPGGNITGTTTASRELSAKRLEVLRTLVPNAVKVAELLSIQPMSTPDARGANTSRHSANSACSRSQTDSPCRP